MKEAIFKKKLKTVVLPIKDLFQRYPTSLEMWCGLSFFVKVGGVDDK